MAKMKGIVIALGLCAFGSVLHAQNQKRSLERQSAVAPLIELDEATLIKGLERLANEVAKTENSEDEHRSDMTELLRYQLLLNLLAHKEPSVIYQVLPHSNSLTNRSGGRSEHRSDLNQEIRLARLERMLQMLLAQQKSASSIVSPTKVIVSDEKPTVQAPKIVVSEKEPEVKTHQSIANDSVANQSIKALEDKLASLQAQLRSIEKTPKKTIELPNLEQGIKPLEHNSQTVIIAMDTIRTTTTEEVAIAADFKRSVYFNVGSSQIDDLARRTLDEVVRFLKDYPQAKLTVSGYASPEGNINRNKRLAEHRLSSVISYLTTMGVEQSRLVHGATDIDRSKSGFQLARRVDLILFER